MNNKRPYKNMMDDALYYAYQDVCQDAQRIDTDIRYLALPRCVVERLQKELKSRLGTIRVYEAEFAARGDEVIPFVLEDEAA